MGVREHVSLYFIHYFILSISIFNQLGVSIHILLSYEYIGGGGRGSRGRG